MTFDDLIKTFKIQPDLNRNIWDESDQLQSDVRDSLLQIAHIFYNSIQLENKPSVQDIVFTGSLANYNYSRLSDIDIHLILKYEDMEGDQDLIEQFFALAKSRWNEAHDIYVKGYEVEVYVEDINHPHISTGLYSILKDKWIKHPVKDIPYYDKRDVLSKVKYFTIMYNHLLHQYREGKLDGVHEKIVLLRDKIKKFRLAGLEHGGVQSTENMAFKLLRRSGILDMYKRLQNKVLDKLLSLESTYVGTTE